MQYSSMNIEKQQKRMKNNFSILHIKLDVESNHSDESDIRRIYIMFLEKHFSAKVY